MVNAARCVPELDRRRAILDAALALFAERGFHGTTMPELATRAGVAAGTIYRYFASKEALVNSVFQREKGALGRALLDDFPTRAPAREQFHEFWRRYSAHALENRSAVEFLERHHHAAYLDDESRAIEARVLQAGVELLVEAQRQGAIKPLSPALLIAHVYGSFASMVKVSGLGFFELDSASIDAAERLVWEGIRS
jgi:TetR/AcrR family transcriptional regulator, repressor of fatR-cypB operon